MHPVPSRRWREKGQACSPTRFRCLTCPQFSSRQGQPGDVGGNTKLDRFGVPIRRDKKAIQGRNGKMGSLSDLMNYQRFDNFCQLDSKNRTCGGNADDAVSYSESGRLIGVDMLHKLAIIPLGGKLGNPFLPVSAPIGTTPKRRGSPPLTLWCMGTNAGGL